MCKFRKRKLFGNFLLKRPTYSFLFWTCQLVAAHLVVFFASLFVLIVVLVVRIHALFSGYIYEYFVDMYSYSNITTWSYFRVMLQIQLHFEWTRIRDLSNSKNKKVNKEHSINVWQPFDSFQLDWRDSFSWCYCTFKYRFINK